MAPPNEPSRGHAAPGEMNSSLRKNIEALRERRRREKLAEGWEEEVADAITRFTGSMRFVYFHLAIYGGWIAVNLIPFAYDVDIEIMEIAHALRVTLGAIARRVPYLHVGQFFRPSSAHSKPASPVSVGLVWEAEIGIAAAACRHAC